MNVVELKDNYLINIGCSLEDKYKYIPVCNHDFYIKELSKESIVLHGLTIPLTRNIANNSVLYSALFYSGNSYIALVDDTICNAKNKSGASLESICSTAFNEGKIYFSDYLKYFAKTININESNYQLLMSLVDSHIVKLSEQIMNIRNGHNAHISKAEDKAQRGTIESNLQTLAEINNAPKVGYSTTYAKPSILGDGVNAYTYGTTFSPMTQNELKAAEMSASMLANFEIKIASESAYDEAVSTFKSFVHNLVYDFCNKVTELFYVKYTELFSPDISSSNDLTVNPLYIKGWVQFVDNIAPDDYSKLKIILDYYHLSITTSLGFKLRDNILKYYDEKRTCDYDGNDLKVYLFLNDIKTPAESEYISARFHVQAQNKLVEAHKAHKSDNSVKASHAEKALADVKRYAHECKYINETDIKKFDEYYEVLVNDLKKYYKENKKELITGLLSGAIWLAIIGGIIWFFFNT